MGDYKIMNQQPSAKKITFIVIAVVIGIILLIAFFIFQQRQADTYSEVEVDQDTGEVYVTYPNREPEAINEQGATGGLIVGGSSVLLENGLTQDQYNLVSQALTKFSSERLDDKYQRLTLRPQDLKNEQNKISTTLRLGNTDTLLPISIKYYDLYKVEVTIFDKSNVIGGTFESGVLDAAEYLSEEEYYD